MGKAVWIVGEPGVGKTTLVRLLLGKALMLMERPKWTRFESAWAAGHYSGGKFDGADTVPYNGVTEALDFWEGALTGELALFDGDRFSFEGAVTRVRGKADTLCVLLQAPEQVVLDRRTARGSTQSPSWVKGRLTKAARFARTFPEGSLLTVDASERPEVYLPLVQQFLGLPETPFFPVPVQL